MKTSSRFALLLLVCSVFGFLGSASAQVTSLIATNQPWRILDTGVTAPANWKTPGFADGSWRQANSSFGYKVDTAALPVITTNGATSAINFNTGNVPANAKWVTTYFRKTFALGAPATLPVALLLAARWDDGIVVYINGVEIRRENMPDGVPANGTLAPVAINVLPDFVSTTVLISNLPANTLIANGNNTIAVELHQAATTSSDVFFDLTLGGLTTEPCFGDATVGIYQTFEDGVEPFLTATHFGYLRASGHTLLQYETWVDKYEAANGYTPPLALLSSHPGDTRQLAFATNSKFIVETERIDTQNYQNMRASVQLRSEAPSATAWASPDYVKATLYTSIDGATFTQTPWFNYPFIALPTIQTTLIAETAPNFWMVPTTGILSVTGATNATPIVITTNSAHGYITGDSVTISGVGGNTAANGTKVITKISDTSFSLNGSVGNAAYTSGGLLLHKTSFNTTTNPPTWNALVPTGWSAYNVPPAPGALTTNYWRSGNLPAASPKGGLGYDNLITGGDTDFNPLLDSLSKVDVKKEMFATSVPVFAGETRLNLRIPFSTVGVNMNDVSKVELFVRYDDGFGAWVNGVKMIQAAEPANDTTNATDRGSNTLGASYNTYDITTLFKANVNANSATNILALRGYNSAANNNDCILQAKLIVHTPGTPVAGSTASFDLGGPMSTLNSAAGLIPNGTRCVKVKFEGTTSGSNSKAIYLDNFIVTGDAKAAVDLGSTLSLQLPVANYAQSLRTPTADADHDGIINLLEYAFGSHSGVSAQTATLPNNTVQRITPVINRELDGRVTMKFRTLLGLIDPLDPPNPNNGNHLDNGYLEIKDLYYKPQLSDDMNNDWLNFGQFYVSAPTVPNGDGVTQTVTITSTNVLVGQEAHQFFRMLVENFRDPWLAPGVTPETQVCPFPETVAW